MSAVIDFGPQAEAVQAILEHSPKLSRDERKRMDDLRDDAFWAAWSVAIGGRAARVGLGAAQYALRDRLGGWRVDYAAYCAALAVLLRHTFTEDEQHHYEALTRPWVTVTGRPAHPEDVTPVAAGTSVPDELEVLSTMVELFGRLDADARSRVLYYLSNRFNVGDTP